MVARESCNGKSSAEKNNAAPITYLKITQSVAEKDSSMLERTKRWYC